MVGFQPLSEETREIAIDGLKKIRTGVLILIITSILLGVVLIASLSMLPSRIFEGDIIAVIMGLGTAMILIVVGLILMLIALFIFIIPGTSRLVSWNEEFSTSSKLLKVGYGGGMLLLLLALIIIGIGGFMVNLGAVLSGLGLAIIAAIMGIVGYIGFIALSFKLNSVFSESIFTVAGILFIIGIFVSILVLIAWILMYIGLGSAIDKLERTGMQTSQPVFQV